jgi:hypothetical protein
VTKDTIPNSTGTAGKLTGAHNDGPTLAKLDASKKISGA